MILVRCTMLLVQILLIMQQAKGDEGFVHIMATNAKLQCSSSQKSTFNAINCMQCIHHCLWMPQCNVINYKDHLDMDFGNCEVYNTVASSCNTVSFKNWTSMTLKRKGENMKVPKSEKKIQIDPSKNAALGFEDRRVANYQLSSSSDYSTSRRAYLARLKNSSPWCAKGTGTNEFVRVDFKTRKLISAIEMQGHPTMGFWVTSYKLKYSEDGYTFRTYQENGKDKVLSGTTAGNSITRTNLTHMIKAFSLLINPQTHAGYVICMRLEVHGQEDPVQPAIPNGCSNNVGALGMGSGLIQNAKITASSEYDTSRKAYNGRLNHYSAWVASGLNGYLQVEFQSEKMIHAVATQGVPDQDIWVKSYEISYGQRTDQLRSITETSSSTPKIFTGNNDRSTIVKNKFNPPVLAKYIRINVKGYHGAEYGLRAEFFGCDPNSN